MSPQVGKAWFQIAIFILTLSAILSLLTQPGSAEFVISVVSFVIGAVLLLAVIFMVRRANR